MPVTSAREGRSGAPSPPVLPRGAVKCGADGVVSWLRAAVLAFPIGGTDQWLMSTRYTATRYSGGAAPASHRFPCPASATFDCLANVTRARPLRQAPRRAAT